MKRSILICLLPLLLTACGKSISGCDPVGDLLPICGLQAPEDIEVTPDGNYLLLSQFGGIDGGPGSLALFDPRSNSARQLFPLPGDVAAAESWGEEACPGMPREEFSPHGIHLAQREDGAWQVLVVNHGGRESVDFFELTGSGEEYGLSWRGCVELPPPAFLNDVVAVPGGGFLVTHMFDDTGLLSILRGMLGRGDSGLVWQWAPKRGLSVLEGSRGPFTNGIQIAEDGRTVFLNFYMPGLVRKLDRITGEILGEVAMDQPDNSSWLPDGRLLVASHVRTRIPRLCGAEPEGACGIPFRLIAVDPETLEKERIFEHEGAPMGAGTVAVQLGDYLYVGSYSGDRILRVPVGKAL